MTVIRHTMSSWGIPTTTTIVVVVVVTPATVVATIMAVIITVIIHKDNQPPHCHPPHRIMSPTTTIILIIIIIIIRRRRRFMPKPWRYNRSWSCRMTMSYSNIPHPNHSCQCYHPMIRRHRRSTSVVGVTIVDVGYCYYSSSSVFWSDRLSHMC